MPLSSEVVRNKPLGGKELLEVLCKAFRGLLEGDGMFREQQGYGRVAARLRLVLEMDNLSYPRHELERGRGLAPELESFPLQEPSEEAVALDLEREVRVESPNATRILNDLPITIQVVEEGKLVARELKYDKDGVPEQPKPLDLDRSQEANLELKKRKVPKGKKAGGEA